MDTLVLGISLVIVAAGAAMNLVQLAHVRALRRESSAVAEALSRLASKASLHRAPTPRRYTEARSFEVRTTAVRLAPRPLSEADRSRAMMQVLRKIRPGDEPPEAARQLSSGFWGPPPSPPERV